MKLLFKTYFGLTLVSLALLTCLNEARGQGGADLPFDSGSTGADGPLRFNPIGPARYGHAMAFDAARQQVVTFGGVDQNAETWTWDSTNWTRANTLVVPPNAPAGRSYSAMAYDAARGQIVLFGGINNSVGYLQDTWIWNGLNWSNRTSQLAISPSARYQHAMVYDEARQVVVLFGGAGSGNAAETWLWNGTSWTNTTVTGPSARNLPAMAYDSARQRVVLFGGDTGGRETWEWNGASWSNRTALVLIPQNTPSTRTGHSMSYNPISQKTVLFGSANYERDTWEWDGTNWVDRTPGLITPQNSPVGLYAAGMVYDSVRAKTVLFGGNPAPNDTWFWNGSSWSLWGGATEYFDMASRPDGLWQFTSIEVPTNVTVKFLKNNNNTPVRWLASGQVAINGTVDLKGQDAVPNLPALPLAAGGPGGFSGGRGGVATNSSGSPVGTPGQGPGGGLPGVTVGQNGASGQYATAYGNAFIQPLIGGSGGGGGASVATANGGNGGGGGGAIMISSSRDIQVNGVITAYGGNYGGDSSAGGYGSGGAILLRADRISGVGSLNASSPVGIPSYGRIRLEAYFRLLTLGQSTPTYIASAPVTNPGFTNTATLSIISIAGVPVPFSPSGNTFIPDVVFSNAAPVNIVVSGSAIPNNTPVRLQVTTGTGILQATNNMSSGTVTFSLAVPPGVGTVQAFSQILIGN